MFHEDGSSGVQRQTSPPWTRAANHKEEFAKKPSNIAKKEQQRDDCRHNLSLPTVNSLLILPQLLNPEDVQLVPVDVRQETVRLSERWALRCAPAVSHQINTIACTQNTHKQVAWYRARRGGSSLLYFVGILRRNLAKSWHNEIKGWTLT